MIVSLNPENPQPRIVDQITEVLHCEGVIVYPTDTSYSFGCAMDNKKAMERIYRIKKIDHNRPLTFICRDFSHFQAYTQPLSTRLYRSVKQHIPGPYTFIFSASKLVPKVMLSKRKTIGVRIPRAKIAQAIVRQLGKPILSSSIPLTNNNFLEDIFEIHDTYHKHIDLFVDGGPLPVKQSAIIDFSSESSGKVIREGDPPIDVSWIT